MRTRSAFSRISGGSGGYCAVFTAFSAAVSRSNDPEVCDSRASSTEPSRAMRTSTITVPDEGTDAISEKKIGATAERIASV